MNNACVIKTPLGFVAGFSASHQIVQIAATADFAKLFEGREEAGRFIDRYADAGYGLKKSTAEVRPVVK